MRSTLRRRRLAAQMEHRARMLTRSPTSTRQATGAPRPPGRKSAQVLPCTSAARSREGRSTSGMLTILGSGTSGNPITILFEPGANATAPYWGNNGFIYAASTVNYITIDGGGTGSVPAGTFVPNGDIVASANGAALANHVAGSIAIAFRGTGDTGITVQNMQCENMFVAVQNNANNETTPCSTPRTRRASYWRRCWLRSPSSSGSSSAREPAKGVSGQWQRASSSAASASFRTSSAPRPSSAARPAKRWPLLPKLTAWRSQ